jgi:hypothetical protein
MLKKSNVIIYLLRKYKTDQAERRSKNKMIHIQLDFFLPMK